MRRQRASVRKAHLATIKKEWKVVTDGDLPRPRNLRTRVLRFPAQWREALTPARPTSNTRKTKEYLKATTFLIGRAGIQDLSFKPEKATGKAHSPLLVLEKPPENPTPPAAVKMESQSDIEDRLSKLEHRLQQRLDSIGHELRATIRETISQHLGKPSEPAVTHRLVSELARLEDEYAESEALQFSQEQLYGIVEYADSKGYVYEPAGFGVLIFDRDHAEDVRRYAAQHDISYRVFSIVDPLVNPDEAAEIVDRIRARGAKWSGEAS